MAVVTIPLSRSFQPEKREELDYSHPMLEGVTNALLMCGDMEGWRSNNATGDFGSLFGDPTLNGALASDIVEDDYAIVFDGTSTYLDLGTLGVPTTEFTLYWGGIFDDNDSPRGFVDCTNNGVSGWNIYQDGTDGMYFNNSSYPAGNPTTGWTVGQFWHGALRNKGGVSSDWYRNGAKVATGTGVSPAAPTLPLWIGKLKVGAVPFIKGRFSYFYLVDKYHSDDIVAGVADSPYEIFGPRRRIINLSVTTGGINLTGANSAESSTSSTGVISQGHNLSGTNSTEASSSSTAVITQEHALTGANSSQTDTSGIGTVALNGALSGTNCVQTDTSSTGAITQTHILSGSNCVESSDSATGSLVSNNITLTADSCLQQDTCDSGSIDYTIIGQWNKNLANASTWMKDSSTSNIWS